MRGDAPPEPPPRDPRRPSTPGTVGLAFLSVLATALAEITVDMKPQVLYGELSDKLRISGKGFKGTRPRVRGGRPRDAPRGRTRARAANDAGVSAQRSATSTAYDICSSARSALLHVASRL